MLMTLWTSARLLSMLARLHHFSLSTLHADPSHTFPTLTPDPRQLPTNPKPPSPRPYTYHCPLPTPYLLHTTTSPHPPRTKTKKRVTCVADVADFFRTSTPRPPTSTHRPSSSTPYRSTFNKHQPPHRRRPLPLPFPRLSFSFPDLRSLLRLRW